VRLVFFVQFVFLDEWIRLRVIVDRAEHEPDTTDEIGDNNGNDDQSKDLVDI
jgi:hypothetical protein